jgi:hypothetical protein
VDLVVGLFLLTRDSITNHVSTGLLESKEPVLIYVPPAPDSPFSHAQRIFLNNTNDRNGPARQLQSTATTSVKRAKAKKETPSGIAKPSEERVVISVHSHSPSVSPRLTRRTISVHSHSPSVSPRLTRRTRSTTRTAPSNDTSRARYRARKLRKLTVIDSDSDDDQATTKVFDRCASRTDSDSEDEGGRDATNDDEWKEGEEGHKETLKGAGVLKRKGASHHAGTKKARTEELGTKGKGREVGEGAGKTPKSESNMCACVCPELMDM